MYLYRLGGSPPVIGTQATEVSPSDFEHLKNINTENSELLHGETVDLQTKATPNGMISLDMAVILDDDHLNKLLCSQCNKYLSVLPIKVYPDDVVKCGRCCKENDGGTMSLYENLVKNCLFKCINRYEHCAQLLTVSEVTEHEKECFGSTYDCPKCDLKFTGSAYELLYHFKDKHPTSILESNTFYVEIKGMPFYKERYLYLRNDIIFFILVENLYGEKLYLSVVSLTPYKDITQQFDLKFLGETVETFKTELKPCASLKSFDCDYFKIEIGNVDHERIKCKVNIHLSKDMCAAHEVPSLCKKPKEIPVATASIQTTPLEQITGIELTDQFRQDYPNYNPTACGTALFEPGGQRIELTCSKCSYFTGRNVFSCINDVHIMCWECRNMQCKCNVPTGGWNANLASINELLLLPCRWKCGMKFSGNDLRHHESQCVHNYRRTVLYRR